MRASGRGGRRGPRGAGSPRGPFLRLWGVYARGPLPRSGGHAACGAFPHLAGFLCAESLYV